MLIGAHSIIYSTRPEEDRAFLRDVLRLPNVDVGEGWLIFGLPPAEVAVHPSRKNDVHEFYFMCADARAFVAKMKDAGVECTPIQDQGYGLVFRVVLPGGGKLGVYEPRHARPKPMAKGANGRAAKKSASKGRATRSSAAKSTSKRKPAKRGSRSAR